MDYYRQSMVLNLLARASFEIKLENENGWDFRGLLHESGNLFNLEIKKYAAYVQW